MKFITSVLIALAITTTSLIAHSHSGGHSHKKEPIDKATAEKKSLKILNNFIEKKVIDESWEGIEVESSYTEMFQGHKEWVVTFKNDKIKDVKKQKLYVFWTITGKYVAANHTGE